MDTETKTNPLDDEYDHQTPNAACDSMPNFTRLRYFHGQMLVANDLQTEQDYFREKLKLLNRCLEGYGTVCGLKVVHIKEDKECETGDYDPKQQSDSHHGQQGEESDQTAQQSDQSGQEHQRGYDDRKHEKRRPSACVEIECGLALDCEGNELVVRQPLRVDLWKRLSDAERKELWEAIEKNPERRPRVYLSICYCVQPLDPVRPVIPDACSAVSECVYSKLRDTVKVKLSLQRPEVNHCRDNCCEKCKDKCLLLAVILFEKGKPIVVRNDIRRWITTYEPVTITGVNWVHGADNYTPAEAGKILREDGLTIQFSRPIKPETVKRGVVDVLIFEGGSGKHAAIHYLDGIISTTPDNRHVVFKYTARETLQNLDRVLIIVRTDFILDDCCRPVDGNHTGGRVPLLRAFAENAPKAGMPEAPKKCLDPYRRYGAWTSGNGNPGGTFESWFYIEPEPEPPTPKPYGQEDQGQSRYINEDEL